MNTESRAIDYGTVNYEGQAIALTDQAECTSRLLDYDCQFEMSAPGRQGDAIVVVYWIFDHVEGRELDCYDYDNVDRVTVVGTAVNDTIGPVKPLNTIEALRHIASNPDGCDSDDVLTLANWIGTGRPSARAAQIWPSEFVDAIPGYTGDRIVALITLQDYCGLSSLARHRRSIGHIDLAMESKAEKAYHSLPEWAKW